MNSDQLLESLSLGEDHELEFKSARGGVPKSLWETYCAFANTDGGVIVLGVKQHGSNRFEVQGLEDAEKARQDFWNSANNPSIVNKNLLREEDVQILRVDEKDVLVIEVRRADRFEQPIHLGQNPIGHTFQRYNEGDYRCNDKQVRRMLSDGSEESFDKRVVPFFGMDDIHRESLNGYRNRFRSRSATHPWNEKSDKDFLGLLGGWRKDRANKDEGLTIAGLLMFGKETAIADPNSGVRMQVDYRDRRTDEVSERWADRVWQDGTWNANLYQFFFKAYPKLVDGLKIPFRYQPDPDLTLEATAVQRVDDTVVHEAIREAFVNCLIHADYRGQGGIVIDHYADRFEFSDPGVLLISFRQVVQGGISECRNESLQKMFSLIGFGEQAGSGIDKMREGWKSQKWRVPLIERHQNPDRVKLKMPMVSLLPEESVARLRQVLKDAVDQLHIDEIQALVTADIEGSVSNIRLQQFLDSHPADITKMLKGLRERGLLKKDGKGRGAVYRLSSRFDGSDTATGVSDGATGISDRATGIKPEPSGINNPKLLELSLTARENKRMAPREMRNIILELCTQAELTTAQLSELLSRSPDRLQRGFLKPMVEAKVLKLKFPREPSHPKQAYYANEDPL